MNKFATFNVNFRPFWLAQKTICKRILVVWIPAERQRRRWLLRENRLKHFIASLTGHASHHRKFRPLSTARRENKSGQNSALRPHNEMFSKHTWSRFIIPWTTFDRSRRGGAARKQPPEVHAGTRFEIQLARRTRKSLHRYIFNTHLHLFAPLTKAHPRF